MPSTAISESQTRRNGLRIMTAGAVAQACSVAVYPLVARLYTPEDIAVLSVLLAVVGIFTTIACGRYEQAIMVETLPQRSHTLLILSLLLSLTTSAILAVADVVIGPRHVAELLRTPALEPYTWIVAPLVMLSSVGYALTFHFNRGNRFGLTQRYILTQGISNNALKIALAPLPGGLCYANVASQIAGLAAVVRRGTLWNNINRGIVMQIPRLARRHWRFPAFNLPHALVSTVASNLPVLILAYTFDSPTVGIFALCISFGYRPVNVVAQSTMQALFHSATHNRSLGIDYARHLRRFLLRSALILLPVTALLYWQMPTIIPAIFGSTWHQATAIMQALLPLFALTILSTPLSFVPLMQGKQAKAMTIEIFSALARTATLIVAAMNTDIATTTTAYSLIYSAFLAAQLAWYVWLIQRDRLKNV